MRERSKWISLAAAIVWCSLIFASSSTVILPQRFFAWIGENLLTGDEGLARFKWFWAMSWIFIVKGWHATEFAILFMFIRAMSERFSRLGPTYNTLGAIVFCLLFAVSDEFHQTFVPRRGGNGLDVAIDAGGVGAGSLIWIICRRRDPTPNPSTDPSR